MSRTFSHLSEIVQATDDSATESSSATFHARIRMMQINRHFSLNTTIWFPGSAGRSLGTSVFEVAIGEKCRIFIELHIQAGAEVRKWILGAVTLSTVLSIGRILIRLS